MTGRAILGMLFVIAGGLITPLPEYNGLGIVITTMGGFLLGTTVEKRVD